MVLRLLCRVLNKKKLSKLYTLLSFLYVLFLISFILSLLYGVVIADNYYVMFMRYQDGRNYFP